MNGNRPHDVGTANRIEPLMRAAERLDELADIAELMSDSDGAERLRASAAHQRMRAMELLDD